MHLKYLVQPIANAKNLKKNNYQTSANEDANFKTKFSIIFFNSLPLNLFKFNSEDKIYTYSPNGDPRTTLQKMCSQMYPLLSDDEILSFEGDGKKCLVLNNDNNIVMKADTYKHLVVVVNKCLDKYPNKLQRNARKFLFLKDKYYVHIPEPGLDIAGLISTFNRQNPGEKFFKIDLRATTKLNEFTTKTYSQLKGVAISPKGFNQWCEFIHKKPTELLYSDIKEEMTTSWYDTIEVIEKAARPPKKKPKVIDTIEEIFMKDKVTLPYLGTFSFDATAKLYYLQQDCNNLEYLASYLNNLIEEFIPVTLRPEIKLVANTRTQKIEMSMGTLWTLAMELTKNKEESAPYEKWTFSKVNKGYIHITEWGIPTSSIRQKIKIFCPHINFSCQQIEIIKDGKYYKKNVIQISEDDFQKWNKIFKIQKPIVKTIDLQARDRGYYLKNIEDLEEVVHAVPTGMICTPGTFFYPSVTTLDNYLLPIIDSNFKFI